MRESNQKSIKGAFFSVMVFFLVHSKPVLAAEAAEAFVYPTFAELTQTALMLGAFETGNSGVIKEYARLIYCDLFKKNIADDFAWNKLERQIAGRVTTKREYFRRLYQLVGDLTLDPYDFKTESFPLANGTEYKNVGYMSLFSMNDFRPYCQLTDTKTGGAMNSFFWFPPEINVSLAQPFNLDRIKIPASEAKRLLQNLSKGSGNRNLYIRFRFRLDTVKPIAIKDKTSPKVDFQGELVGVDLFYDRELTKWMMSLPPIGVW